jgi:hypothetical protein
MRLEPCIMLWCEESKGAGLATVLLTVKILLSGWERLWSVPKSLTQIGRYRWCGHGVLMGKIQNR